MAFTENPGYSLSLNVQDLKDRYEVRAFLPNAKDSDVNVSLQNSQTLKVEVSNQNTETSGKKDANTSVTEWGQYEQTIQLPAPVKTDQMKIEHQGHELSHHPAQGLSMMPRTGTVITTSNRGESICKEERMDKTANTAKNKPSRLPRRAR